jgi:hypothetical protein
MTIPSTNSPIAISDIETEIGLPVGTTTDLNFLNSYIKPTQAPTTPNMTAFWGLKYYLQNNAGNCNNANINNCNCNNGDSYQNCIASNNCTPIGQVNCDAQSWLQTGDCNLVPAPTYNCTSDQNCFLTNCAPSGGGGGKIICTKLHEIGLMNKNIFEADQAFGEHLIKTNPDIYYGYRAWAEIVVDWMSGKGPKMMPWMNDEDFSVAAKKWSTTWAYDIATPWAEEMAYMMGEKETGSLTGKMIMAFGIPICKVIGVWQRWFGPSKKEPGFVKGAGLVVIFVGFKLVAELGRMIERVILKKELSNV